MKLRAIQDRIATLVRPHAAFIDPGQLVPIDADLSEAGVDSLGMALVMVAIEEEFGIVFPDSLLVDEWWRSIESISRAVEQQLNDHEERTAQ